MRSFRWLSFCRRIETPCPAGAQSERRRTGLAGEDSRLPRGLTDRFLFTLAAKAYLGDSVLSAGYILCGGFQATVEQPFPTI